MCADRPSGPIEIIFIHGAPGIGKSTVAEALHQQLKTPWFEFGWIPEFRLKGEAELTYEQEELLSFENLSLVVRNYLRHGFKNIIITDLRDHIIQLAMKKFSRNRCLLITLFISDEETLKRRVLDETRSSGFRDWQEALEMNSLYRTRPELKNEFRIDVTDCPVRSIVNQIIALLD